MKVVTKYEANDGELFNYEEDCLRHEKRLEATKKANEMIQQGVDLYDVFDVFYDGKWDIYTDICDDAKEVFRGFNKDVELIIEHWQCKRTPGYKLCYIDHRGRIYIHGDVGSWSGSYGSWVSSRDLVRYILDTKKMLDTEQ